MCRAERQLVQYARGRFWKGGTFIDLADARRQAERWCLEVAGQRVHGTIRKLPLVVFEDEERAHLLPYDGIPYDVPLWKDVTVHPDHHVSVQYALYSAPSTTCPPGTKLEARCDRDLVKLYKAGALVKVHPRKPKGGRSTDADDYPPERTAYAMRAPDRLVRQAVALGPQIGQFAERLLDAPFPWSKLRQGQRLLRLAERYTPERLEAACARARVLKRAHVGIHHAAPVRPDTRAGAATPGWISRSAFGSASCFMRISSGRMVVVMAWPNGRGERHGAEEPRGPARAIKE